MTALTRWTYWWSTSPAGITDNLRLGELINQENIDAKLNDGVLRLSLPKVEKATPKKITVKTG